jgi:hypothetical protein
MNVGWDYQLKKGERDNPVMETRFAGIPLGAPPITDAALKSIFKGAQSLKTWGRPGKLNGNEPHWIGVCKGTPLHRDPSYPRYTHQLFLRVDHYVVRGLSKVETALKPGLYYCLDTHSPHQVLAKDPFALWYVAVSMDRCSALPADEALPALIEYAQTKPFLTPDILRPNNGGRW